MATLFFKLVILFVAFGYSYGEDLATIEEDFWEWRLWVSPEFSSSVGFTQYNDLLASYNTSLFESRKIAVERFLQRLENVDPRFLDKTEKINYMILKDHLQTYLDGYEWRLYESLNPMSFLEGIQTNPVHFTEILPFDSLRDYQNYLERLRKLPHQLSEFQALFEEAIRRNRTLHRVSIEPVPAQIEKLLVEDVTTSPFYAPFSKKLDDSRVPEHLKNDIREMARERMEGVFEAFKRLKIFIENEYLAHTRPSWGIGQWEGGLDNYRACLRWHLSLEVSPDHVHRLGLSEVDRIQKKMEHTMGRLNFTGSISDFFNMVRADNSFHMDSGDALLQRYRSIIYDEIFPQLPDLFDDIPDLPLKVSPMPFDGVGGEYLAGTVDGSRAGVFYVNLFHPKDIATIDMKSLSLHETVPGHHLQAIYALAADLPSYRKFHEDTNYWQVPFKFPFYTAYLEGWALYAEYLGEDMGLYKNDYELMGRYGSEMFRACRLVVDTGIHYFNWSKEDAVSYMLSHTAYTRQNIMSEVHRYITWPGQACAYKIGEIKIRQLRERAMDVLGPYFDMKEFHGLILKNGPVPMTVLETMVDEWLMEYQNVLNYR